MLNLLGEKIMYIIKIGFIANESCSEENKSDVTCVHHMALTYHGLLRITHENKY